MRGDPSEINAATSAHDRAARDRLREPEGWEADARAEQKAEAAGRELPILFSDAMVRAILDGRKTVTRRVIMPQPSTKPGVYADLYNETPNRWAFWMPRSDGRMTEPRTWTPRWVADDLLYVREGFWQTVPYPYTMPSGEDSRGWGSRIHFAADGPPANTPNRHYPEGLRGKGVSAPDPDACWFKRPSIHLPKRLSRLWLRVVSVRVERLQDIAEEDARREGCEPVEFEGRITRSRGWVFKGLWDSINGKRDGASWAANPWVWRVEFRREER